MGMKQVQEFIVETTGSVFYNPDDIARFLLDNAEKDYSTRRSNSRQE